MSAERSLTDPSLAHWNGPGAKPRGLGQERYWSHGAWPVVSDR